LQKNEGIFHSIYFSIGKNGLLRFRNRLCVPNSVELNIMILNELHKKPYFVHLGYKKMITYLRKQFYGPNMKSKIDEYLSKCLECQQVKYEHQHPKSILQPLPIPEWKWEIISVDFITWFPNTQRQNDSIMVVIDKLSNSTQFILVKSTYNEINIAEIFMKEIVRLHGILNMVISNRDVKFTSNFWKELFAGLGTNLNLSSRYHPHTYGKIELMNQIIKICYECM